MAPYGSAIKAWPSGQIMATPMITRPVVIPRAMQSRSHLIGFLRSAASGQLTAALPTRAASPVNQLVHCKICSRHLPNA